MSNTKLHKLIQSLNQAEKRYFKLFMKRYSHNNESSIFGQLFDFLAKTKKYNKQELLEKNQYINPDQLNNIKNRLYNYILLSLRTYNSNTTTSAKIDLYQTMINVEILISKGLYTEGWKMLTKAEKLAERNELYRSLKEILDQKRNLANTRIKSKNIKKEMLTIRAKQEKTTKILSYIEQQDKIYKDLYELFKSEGRILRDHRLLKNIKKEIAKIESVKSEFLSSHQANYLLNYNLRFIFQFTAEWENANKMIDNPIEKYHKSKTLNTDNFLEYRRQYTAKIIGLNNLGQFEEVRNLIQKIKEISKIKPKNKEIDLTVFEDTFFFELESYLFEFNFDKAVEIIQENKERIHSLEDQMNNVNQQSKRYRIALSYFGANDFEEALNWINKIIALDELKYRKDILASVQLLNLLIHFELKNYKLVKNKIKSVATYLKKINRFLIPEKLLLSTLSKIVGSKQRKQDLFKKLKNQLETHFKTNTLDSYFFCYFDLPKWLEKKIDY